MKHNQPKYRAATNFVAALFLFVCFHLFDVFGLVNGKVKTMKAIILRKLYFQRVDVAKSQYSVGNFDAEQVTAHGSVFRDKMHVPSHGVEM
jgi:hypothetical protein